MAIVEVSIVPIGTADTSVSEYIADAVQELKKSGLTFRLTPMGTIIEGDIKEVIDTVLKMHETPFAKAAKRVYTTIKIDDRRDKHVEMFDKINSVEKKIRK